jgi:Xaa-Pro aminopeptidase
MLLVDTGVSIGGYKGDVTRTFPVGGSFSRRQRLVYETVLEAQREAIASSRPGALLGDIKAPAIDVNDRAGFGKDFYHGTSLHLGLETHDVGDPYRPLVEGNVITVEPGVYIAAEGLGIRIEDDVLVGADGPRILSDAIPRAVEAIEERMAGTRS